MPARWIVIAGVAISSLISVTSPARAQQLTYSGSVTVAEGDYLFTERTRSAYVSNGLQARTGRFTFSATIPIVLQDSPWVSYSAAGTIPTGGTNEEAVGRRQGGGPPSGSGTGHHKTSFVTSLATSGDPVSPADTVSYSELGVGDPSLRMEILLVKPSEVRPAISLSASVKPPLADAQRGFGTGAWDAGLGVSAVSHIGRVVIFASGEYWSFGDMPELVLESAWSYGVAVGVSAMPGTLAALVSYSGFTRIIDGAEPARQVGIGLSLTPGGRYALNLSGSLGLTEGASDYSAGIGWSISF